MNLANLARKIIKTNYYMTISTTDGRKPWISPVFFWNDKNYNFYFVSVTSTRHIKNVRENPKVAVVIFDSQAKPLTGNGVYVEGEARMLEDGELPKILPSFWKKHFPNLKERAKHDLSIKRFSGKSPEKFFRITPQKIWILDPNAKEDRRIKIKLKK